jgi:hypothetical protein
MLTRACVLQAWRDKYHFNFWRPIIGIRNADQDNQAGTKPFRDPKWVQLGAPRTNQDIPGIQPAFPAYPSGHATIGTAAFEVVRKALNIAPYQRFYFVSDEFNGVNEDRNGKPRPSMTRPLTIDDAIDENQRSRVFLGVHWNFDSTGGGELGKAIASNVVKNFPRRAQ